MATIRGDWKAVLEAKLPMKANAAKSQYCEAVSTAKVLPMVAAPMLNKYTGRRPISQLP